MSIPERFSPEAPLPTPVRVGDCWTVRSRQYPTVQWLFQLVHHHVWRGTEWWLACKVDETFDGYQLAAFDAQGHGSGIYESAWLAAQIPVGCLSATQQAWLTPAAPPPL
jgi:hypothetical protein